MNTTTIALEVLGLHHFLQSWFNGTVPQSPESFERLATAWPQGFTLIAPDHARRGSVELLAATYAQHARWPALTIEIRNLEARVSGGVAIAHYEEWHIDPSATEARMCSATFAVVDGGLRWVHIHESRLASPDSGDA